VTGESGETLIFAYPAETNFRACHIRCHSAGTNAAREAKRLQSLLLFWIQERGNIESLAESFNTMDALSSPLAASGSLPSASASTSASTSPHHGGTLSNSNAGGSGSNGSIAASSANASNSSNNSTSNNHHHQHSSNHGSIESRLRRRKLLVIVNPVAGPRGGWHTWNRVASIFEEASGLLEFEVKETKYRGHAHEIISQHPLESYSGVVSVGGDGTLFEVLNSLMQVQYVQQAAW
jgi:hypothetical protein